MSKKQTVTISATASDIIAAGGRSIIRIDFPTMTGTAVTIQGGELSTTQTFKTLGDQNAAFSIASPSGRSVTLAPYLTYGYSCLRLVSGTNESTPRLIDVYLNDYLG